jgi:hypothetical protein
VYYTLILGMKQGVKIGLMSDNIQLSDIRGDGVWALFGRFRGVSGLSG